jgi:acetyl esterase/lipase
VPKSHVYKTVEGVDIHADVYRGADERVRPVVVWIHGGALINGGRGGVPEQIRGLCREQGYVLFSLDYRLAPETKLPEIIADLKDAFVWIRAEGPKLFAADPTRLVVTGGSAGGYLTMMSGVVVDPKPTALVAFWGYGDVDGDWYAKPSEFYRTSAPMVEKDAALAAVGKGIVTGTDAMAADQRQARGKYYLYLRQNGLWTKEVSGFDPSDTKQIDPYCPVRNITPDYPPILMIHGTDDSDVPYSKSADMARELKRHGVKHELVTVQRAGHGLSGGRKEDIEAAHNKALEFIRLVLREE